MFRVRFIQSEIVYTFTSSHSTWFIKLAIAISERRRWVWVEKVLWEWIGEADSKLLERYFRLTEWNPMGLLDILVMKRKWDFVLYVCPTTGNYSCLRVELTFNRDRAFYFTTVFIPDIILVTSSFITFWLEWNAVPARVMLGVTTMLNFFTTR
jgi:hypothetical protein